MLALNANLKQTVLVLRRQRCDWLRLKIPGLAVARNYLIAFVNVLDRDIAMVGVDRRSSRRVARVPDVGLLRSPKCWGTRFFGGNDYSALGAWGTRDVWCLSSSSPCTVNVWATSLRVAWRSTPTQSLPSP